MQRKVPLETGEIYHIYNRGAHKADIFTRASEYERFQALILIGNDREPTHLANVLTKYKGPTFIKIFEEMEPPPENCLVQILAYCLMPNHFHMVLRQVVDGGITSFMRKISTAYAMYFNARHEHSGTLFQGKFKSTHIISDAQLRWSADYVHLNPVDLTEPGWKERGVVDVANAERFLQNYRWSSWPDLVGGKRPEGSILTHTDLLADLDFSRAVESIHDHEL